MKIKLQMVAALAFSVATLIAAVPNTAMAGKLLTQTGVQCCPVCDHVCKLEAEVVDKEYPCFNIESKVI